MRTIFVLKFLAWFVLTWIAEPVRAQTDALALADSLAAAGQYDHARHEYARWLYFADEPDAAARVLSQLGQLEERLGQYEAARAAYERVIQSASEDSLRRSAIFRYGFCSFLLDKYAEGHFYLQTAVAFDTSDVWGRRAAWLDALCLVGMEAYEPARALVRDLYAYDCETSFRLEMAFADAARTRYLSDSRAQWLSILPGLGLLYVGSFKDAVVSVGLTGGLMAVGVIAVLNQHYIFAVLSCVLLAQRFYEGGARLAGKLAEQRNVARRYAVRKSLQLELLHAPVYAP